MSTTTYTKNQQVRFTTDNLGVMRDPYGTKTVKDVVVNAGDTGTYLEKHEILGDEGWHVIIANLDIPAILFVNVHESMFEAVES